MLTVNLPKHCLMLKNIVLVLLSYFTFLNAEHTLSVCTIFKDNAPYFREWIEFHRLVGVEHFYLYNNESEDNFHDVLDPYVREGIVTLIEWPNQPKRPEKRYDWVKRTQESAYNHCCSRVIGKTKWLAVIDTDEFLVPDAYNNIVEYLQTHDDESAIFVFWRVYGTSGIYDIPPNQLLIEMLTKRFPLEHEENQQGKLIVKPEEVIKFTWAGHQCFYRNFAIAFVSNPFDIRINHYVNRTIKFFYEKKIPFKKMMDNATWTQKEIEARLTGGNDVEDRIMDRFISSLRKNLGM